MEINLLNDTDLDKSNTWATVLSYSSMIIESLFAIPQGMSL